MWLLGLVRDWSLITRREGVYKIAGGGGGVKFYPCEKGGTKSYEVVLTQELEVLAKVMGGAKSFHPLKGGGGCKQFYLVLRRGGGG